MAKLGKEQLSSPAGMFIIYMAASLVAVLGFFICFPPEPSPLRFFFLTWRFTLALREYITFFPALAMSALVIPFGLKSSQAGRFNLLPSQFIERFRGPLFCALGAAVIYGLLFFLAFPMVKNAEADMRFKGVLFTESLEKAVQCAEREAWPDAGRFMAVCEGIWPGSPETDALRHRVFVELEAYYRDRRLLSGDSSADDMPKLQRRHPVDALEALQYAEEAYREERYYDSHWLATLAGRLSPPGSVEGAKAAQEASKAWNAVASLAPNSREARAYSLYNLKHSGYEAMIAEDWIRAYYIFNELSGLTPDDPDVVNFLAESKAGLAGIAFFADEMELTVGEILTGAVFSLPGGTDTETHDGRTVLRFGALSTFSDVSYGTDLELITFDGTGRLTSRLSAPYVKILPKTLGAGRVTVCLLRALDRRDEEIRWNPVWAGLENAGNTQIALDIPYEDFLFVSQVRRGLDNFFLGDLFAAERSLGPYGFIPQVFQVELLTRLAEPVLFLPVLILTILWGWSYRSKKPPRYLGIPLLVLLPLVLSGAFHVYRSLLYTLGIWAVLSVGFTLALVILVAGAVVCFMLALLWLAAQREHL